MTAPHSSGVPKGELVATMADIDPLLKDSIIPFDDIANKPDWAHGATRQTVDLPPVATEAWSGPAETLIIKARSIPFSVDPNIPYRLSFWAKASLAGSRMFLELRHNSLDHSVLSGTVGVLNDNYLIGRLDIPTEWTYFESIIRIKPEATQVFIGSIYYNHSSATVTNAVQSLADLRLEPAYVREGDPRLTDQRQPKMHTHDVPDINATGRTTANYLRGDGTWATPTNTTYTVMSEAEATAGTATTARTTSAARLKGAIQRWATGSYSTAISAIGQALNKAATAAEARTAIGAGTSDLALGTTSTTAKAGNWVPAVADVTGLNAALDSKVAKAGDAATVWSGTQAQYDALPTGTKNALGFIAVIR